MFYRILFLGKASVKTLQKYWRQNNIIELKKNSWKYMQMLVTSACVSYDSWKRFDVCTKFEWFLFDAQQYSANTYRLMDAFTSGSKTKNGKDSQWESNWIQRSSIFVFGRSSFLLFCYCNGTCWTLKTYFNLLIDLGCRYFNKISNCYECVMNKIFICYMLVY